MHAVTTIGLDIAKSVSWTPNKDLLGLRPSITARAALALTSPPSPEAPTAFIMRPSSVITKSVDDVPSASRMPAQSGASGPGKEATA